MSRPAPGREARANSACPTCSANRTSSGCIRDLTLATRALTAAIRTLRTGAPKVSESGQGPAGHPSTKLRRAAAELRVKIDRQAGRQTPSWIRELAEG